MGPGRAGRSALPAGPRPCSVRLMAEVTYAVRGFLTVRRDRLRVGLRGSLVLRVDPHTGLFTGPLELRETSLTRRVLGAALLATVRITPESPVIGGPGPGGGVVAVVCVSADITAVLLAGHALPAGSCHTATEAVVPLRSGPGFDLERGGRLAGRYQRPAFTGDGWLTRAVNLTAAGPGNTAVVDLTPIPASQAAGRDQELGRVTDRGAAPPAARRPR
jgi:hypothetical protein